MDSHWTSAFRFCLPQPLRRSAPAPLSGEPLDVRNFGLLQISREKSRKTEEVFLVGSRGLRGEIEIPPGSFSFASVFFWRSKRKCWTAVANSRKCSYIDKCIVDHKNGTNSPEISVKSVYPAWADVGIGPYNEMRLCIRIRRRGFHLIQLPSAASQALRASIPTPIGPSGHFPLIGGIGPWKGSLWGGRRISVVFLPKNFLPAWACAGGEFGV